MNQSIFVFFISLLMLAGSGSSAISGTDAVDEIHVLIDVSGSMKQNDPQNLRREAAQLLINLLPDNVKATLWLFAEKTDKLVSTDSVDDEWRKQAQKTTKSIHSRGMYTDIEAAIQTVLQDGLAGSASKNLILLTDGMVDISKDIMISADSRERILSEWIPRLRQQNIKVNTIALSEQSDKELMEKLAFDSGGWTENAESAEQLQHLFWKMAQKVAAKDTVPLDNNQFSIDGSIQEFSVLVFKKVGTSPTQLITPDQQKIDKKTTVKSVSWLESSGYDLITIKQPMTGDWRIEATTDPDNQVMILTNLKLKLDELTNFIGENDLLPLKLYFTEQDQLITQADFLSLVTISVTVDQQEPIKIQPFNSEPGYFFHKLNDLAIGKHNLTIVADGKTFKREIVRDIQVISTPIMLEKLIDRPNRQVTLKFTPKSQALEPSTLVINAQIHQDDKEPQSLVVLETEGEWLLKLDSLPAGQTMLINFNIIAKTLDGNVIKPALTPISIDDSLFLSGEPEKGIESISPQQAPPEPESDSEMANEQEQAQPEDAPDSEYHWGMTIGIVLIVNLLLCGLGFITYKFFKKASAKKQQQILEKLT